MTVDFPQFFSGQWTVARLNRTSVLWRCSSDVGAVAVDDIWAGILSSNSIECPPATLFLCVCVCRDNACDYVPACTTQKKRKGNRNEPTWSGS